MKFFPLNEEIDRQVEIILGKIRHLKNGETAELINNSGARYRLNYGVSIIYLRKMAKELEADNELARRLWYREVRETMIMATMVSDAKGIERSELEAWGKKLNTLELSEQMGRNLLSQLGIGEEILLDWLDSENMFQRYASAMAIGWRLREKGHEGFKRMKELMPSFKHLIEEKQMHRAVGFAMKMGGRFCEEYRGLIEDTINLWLKEGSENEMLVAEEVRYELEAF
ncbi:DNA alkylation repair protein [Thermophagus sp. OGC60D27]|uniref:DNA alkylation repair protein n=1 Tax=Thermophagus sp. OGC60D27 TaxID=3458415 RepID=UPI004037D797